MSTNLHLQPTVGALITETTDSNPIRKVKVTSETRDADFHSSFVKLHYAYGGGGTESMQVSFDDIDMVVDALLEHQAARKGRLEEAATIGEVKKRREKYRAKFEERRAKK
ncbi:hypothetical protein SEA_TEMPO_90 [Microbacterium phage Tempo]|nr:hypothetical protein SEA_TEMPO_90 [Microbacterium phage Tempo]QKO02840.1 hypothetical protein SEA_KELCOLE_88 [Microbacterium phage Kelcole]UOW92835.1 hypothetical protein SEA_ROBINROSE_92 [Microbacterium phage RobinRose]